MRVIILLVLFSGAMPAMAYDWHIETRVRLVEPTYMPKVVAFQVNDNAGECSAGSWMKWNAKGTTELEKSSNANAVYATLMAALIAGKTVRIYGNNDNCSVDFLHLY